METHIDYTRKRIEQIGPRILEKVYAQTQPLDKLLVCGPVDRITFAEAQKLSRFRAAKLGDQFGPLWATYWFRAQATVPKAWAGRRVDVRWESHSEATLWVNGRSIQGLNHDAHAWDGYSRTEAILARSAAAGQKLTFQLEMACNKPFGTVGDNTYGVFKNISPYVLDRAEIALFDQDAWDLYFDFIVLQGLETDGAGENKGLDRAWAGHLLYELNRFANAFDADDRRTWKDAAKILQALYRHKNADLTHQVSAIGHAHIDTAWLWTLAETDRKCERTYSTATTYMDDYSDYKFACSAAYHFDVIKRRNPDLYKRIKAKVKTGQFIPVGGTWIEPDCNIPSGESLARQFLHGQRFFRQEFGITCKEFWNPDVFGYNGQLPQLCRGAGAARFLTQKLSWNKFNKPAHHTFTWQGIDGSEVLAHFPPCDSYNATANVSLTRYSVRNFKDHERSRHSLMPYGFGDGGGGPSKRMFEMLRRYANLRGMPRTQMRSSDEFFTLLEKDCTDRPRMVGELYFEYHRGTYTTQAAAKRGNRQSEFLLHDVEFLACAALRAGARGYAYPAAELDRLWKIVLLNQFHDILPGSSITAVYQDNSAHYREVQTSAGKLRDQAVRALLHKGKAWVPLNTIDASRDEASARPDGVYAFVRAPGYSIGATASSPSKVTCKQTSRETVLENEHLRAVLSADGRLTSLVRRPTGRESLAAPGNVLEIYDDKPTDADAWDVDPYHLETRRPVTTGARAARARNVGPLCAEAKFIYAIGKNSRMTQTVRLAAGWQRLEFHCDVDWQEDRKILKVAFPVDVRAMNATYEMQFGCVERPTHYNTTYDIARFEVPGHKWADLSEHGFGVALLSESKYGFATFANTLRMSLLRASTSPDPKADRGAHHFAYAVMPHAGNWREGGVVAEGFRFNVPVLWARGSAQPRTFASVRDGDQSSNLILDTIKKAEDSDALILRLYEAHGARGTAHVKVDLPFKSAAYCNLLEDQGSRAKTKGNVIEVPYAPYQVITLKLKP